MIDNEQLVTIEDMVLVFAEEYPLHFLRWALDLRKKGIIWAWELAVKRKKFVYGKAKKGTTKC